jgi:uncharacterized integral membrane protein
VLCDSSNVAWPASLVVAILAMVGALSISLVMISWRISASAKGDIGWDPISVWRLQPLVAILIALVIAGIVASSFVFAYRLQARRLHRPA